MSVKFEFYLNDDNFCRLFALKKMQGKDHMTGNDFARELLEKELKRLHPKRVVYEDKE